MNDTDDTVKIYFQNQYMRETRLQAEKRKQQERKENTPVVKPEEVSEEIMSKPEKLDIPVFKADGKLSVQNWLTLFEQKTEGKTTERNKIIVEYLDDEALNFFLERKLQEEDYAVIKTKFLDYFSNEKSVDIQHFLNLNLEDCDTIEQYFRNKTDYAARLNIDEHFLIQLLINGLPHEIKTLNLTKEFTTTNEWLKFNKPIYQHLNEKKEEKRRNRQEERNTMPKQVYNNSNRAVRRFEERRAPWNQQNFSMPPVMPYGYPPFGQYNEQFYRPPVPRFVPPVAYRPSEQLALPAPSGRRNGTNYKPNNNN